MRFYEYPAFRGIAILKKLKPPYVCDVTVVDNYVFNENNITLQDIDKSQIKNLNLEEKSTRETKIKTIPHYMSPMFHYDPGLTLLHHDPELTLMFKRQTTFNAILFSTKQDSFLAFALISIDRLTIPANQTLTVKNNPRIKEYGLE